MKQHTHMTQKQAVLDYLRAGKGITNLKALHEFQVYRLSEVIRRLRCDGHDIGTFWKHAHNGKRYAEYCMFK
jgi:hypothetical protein